MGRVGEGKKRGKVIAKCATLRFLVRAAAKCTRAGNEGEKKSLFPSLSLSLRLGEAIPGGEGNKI